LWACLIGGTLFVALGVFLAYIGWKDRKAHASPGSKPYPATITIGVLTCLLALARPFDGAADVSGWLCLVGEIMIFILGLVVAYAGWKGEIIHDGDIIDP
jgi:hypothetical protein